MKTILAGEALTRALEKHQRFLDEHGLIEDAHVHPTRAWLDALARSPGARRQSLTLRMAKADVRPR